MSSAADEQLQDDTVAPLPGADAQAGVPFPEGVQAPAWLRERIGLLVLQLWYAEESAAFAVRSVTQDPEQP